MKLLIVDDHPGVRAIIRQLSSVLSPVVVESGSGEEALLRVGDFKPDCATVDICMPGMDGFATVKALRERQPGLRCIIVSANDEPELRQQARRLGCVGYITKDRIADLLPLLG